jgi:hypothetical protein
MENKLKPWNLITELTDKNVLGLEGMKFLRLSEKLMKKRYIGFGMLNIKQPRENF